MKKHLILALVVVTSTTAWATCPDGKTYPVTLTFDDGPHLAMTPKVLDVLDQEKVKATFFVLGEHFSGGKANPSNKPKYAILDRMKRSGHVIGSHTYHHYNHPTKTPAQIRENITKPNALLADYLSPVLRLPYGGGAFRSSNPTTQAKNNLVMQNVKDAGFKHVLWDIDTNDWDPKKRPNLEATMLKDICRQKGGIILFHDIQANTVANVQKWIRAIKAEGHPIVGLDHFIPEAKESLAPEYCGLPAVDKKAEDLSNSVQRVLNKK